MDRWPVRGLFVISCAVFSWRVGFAQNVQPPIAPPAATPAQPPVALPATTNAGPSLVVVNPAAARFDAAMATFNASQFADAVTAFSQFLHDFPQDRRDEEALYRLADSYRNLGRAADALAAYDYEIKTYPEGPLRINAQLQRGALLFDAGNMAEAIEPLREVAAKGNAQLQEAARYLLGRALLADGKENEGRPLLQALADAQPPGKYAAGAAQDLAELDDKESRYADSWPLWRKAFDLNGDAAVKPTLAARGGWAALQAKQLDAAEKLFQAARSLHATGEARKVANTGLLRVLFTRQRYADWVNVYNQEKDQLLDGAHAETLYDWGHAEFTLKHWSEAAQAFDQFLREFAGDPAAPTAAYERFLAGAQIDRTKIVAEAEAYLKAWSQSPYRARVELVEAQELSAEGNFAAAVPLWTALALEKGDASWPHRDILLQLARGQDELKQWASAATAYRAYLDDVANQAAGSKPDATQILRAQARLAVCLQNSDQLAAATQAWQVVQSQAPMRSPEQETALESLGLIYAKGGPAQEGAMTATFRALLEQFPQSPLRALAAFTVGDALFKARDYSGAEKYLREAREWDAKDWQQAATQRLALGAYATKDVGKAQGYLKEYDALPLPADPIARQSAQLPAAFYYWLAEDARKKGDFPAAEALYAIVTRHPDSGDLLAGAWWQLGQVQSERKEWASAVASDEKYRALKPETKDATAVLLALGRAQLGAGNLDAAKASGQQALLQEPEGMNSAAARMLLAETAFAARSFAEAARMFATLAVLFDDPKITPQAIARAADAFAAAGDAKAAAQWRGKLQGRFPGYRPASYLYYRAFIRRSQAS